MESETVETVKHAGARLATIHRNGGRPNRYPLRSMEVGEYFLVYCLKGIERDRAFNTLTSCIANIRRRTGNRYHMKTNAMGIEVWRDQ